MSKIVLIRINCPTAELANRLATNAVTNRLAACANIEGPIQSVYHWDGKIETGEEYVLWLKTDKGLWPEVERFIIEHHPDETPAILCLPCNDAHDRYEAWLHSNVRTV